MGEWGRGWGGGGVKIVEVGFASVEEVLCDVFSFTPASFEGSRPRRIARSALGALSSDPLVCFPDVQWFLCGSLEACL